MIATLVILSMAQAAPAITTDRNLDRPVKATALPTDSHSALHARRQDMVAEGRALLRRAERVQAADRGAKGQPASDELQASMTALKADVDSMSEMGEMESAKLQMSMDRLSKMMSTLSNILKKMSDTQDGIAANLK